MSVGQLKATMFQTYDQPNNMPLEAIIHRDNSFDPKYK